MIGLLARQRVRDRLPAFLPEGVVVAHKPGNWSNATHDAGIVSSPRTTYVIVVLSEAAWQPEPIARLSAAVYDYLNPRGAGEQGTNKPSASDNQDGQLLTRLEAPGTDKPFTADLEASTPAHR
jgi:hypothetical protein